MKLIPNAKSSWRLYSQQAFVLVAIIQGVWIGLTPEQQAIVPDNLVNIATLIAAAIGVVARLIVQEEKPHA